MTRHFAVSKAYHGMTAEELDEFQAVAYSYRAWPVTDQAGVIDRFDELCALVDSMLSSAEWLGRLAPDE